MLSTKDAQRHTPAWLSGDQAPVFLVRCGSVIERGQIEAELTAEHRAGRVFAFELLAAFRAGVLALAEPEDRDQLIAIADAEAALEGGEQLPAAEAKLLMEAKTALAEHWPDYRDLVARMARRREIAPIVALRRFLVGWENIPTPFALGPDGRVPLELLAWLDPLEMLSAGNFAYGLLYPGELEGNSPPLSPSDESPRPSPSDEPSKAAGKSRARSGRKTRA
ncbi:hypothetical protein [Sphingomonas morindae]|uniref:Uncharacterized protein n=1 Tax=Sphingomonas morindae TaxID=1541170 RepID=A0ABY4X3Z2_9SPHN|nr:hypothetical protein [Sphingomonas morindae]USI71616.1 hypothetical protein LHA26_09730 [Sphingomonas morindae]